jgi:hypothetical protein
VLNYAAAKRFLKQDGVWHCLLLVRPVTEAVAAPVVSDTDPAATSAADQRAQQLKAEYPGVH